ncbi:MAG: hypothetical protein ACRD0N_14725 [Acidimicrobiales bacterium]
MAMESTVMLVAVGVIVAAIAVYLIAIVAQLRRTSRALRGVRDGVLAIHAQTEPIEAVLGEIATDTGGMAEALTTLVASATGASEAPTVAMSAAVARARRGDGATQAVPAPLPASMPEAVARARSTPVGAVAPAVREVEEPAATVARPARAAPHRSAEGLARDGRRRRPSGGGQEPASRSAAPAARARPKPTSPIDLTDAGEESPRPVSMSQAVARAREAVAK